MRVVVTADGSKSLFSDTYQEGYHSERGALTESRMLFLDASRIAERLQAKLPTTVVELGFGTGLNFFLAADVAITHGTELSFISFEHTLPPARVIRELDYEAAVYHAEIIEAYLVWRESLSTETGVVQFEHGDITLTIVLGDMLETLPEFAFPDVHAVLLDAFSPRTNPEPWKEHVLAHVVKPCVPNAAVVTFTVAGEVRRTLERLGLTVQKLPGPPGGKKEVLRGIKA